MYDPATRTVIDVGASLSAAYDKLGQRPFLPAIVVQLKADKYQYDDYLDLARVLTHELAVQARVYWFSPSGSPRATSR